MTLRIIPLRSEPGLFWIGPEILCVCGGLFVAFGACWGWDHRDPLSLSLVLCSEPYRGARWRSLTFCGFHLFFVSLFVSDAPEAAAEVVRRAP